MQCKPDRVVKVPQKVQNPIYGRELVTRPGSLCPGKMNQKQWKKKGVLAARKRAMDGLIHKVQVRG